MGIPWWFERFRTDNDLDPAVFDPVRGRCLNRSAFQPDMFVGITNAIFILIASF